MAEFSRKKASAAVILLIYMSGKLQGSRDNEIFSQTDEHPHEPVTLFMKSGYASGSSASRSRRKILRPSAGK
jgi:hypothetical protein